MKNILKIAILIITLILVCCILTGCEENQNSSETIEYEYDENNIFGLSSIKIEGTNIKITIIKSKATHCPLSNFVMGNINDYYQAKCKINNKWYKTESYSYTEENGKIIIDMKLKNATKINSFTLANIYIKNFEEPYLEYEITGGEIIEYYTQQYNKETKKWEESKYEGNLVPLEDKQ